MSDSQAKQVVSQAMQDSDVKIQKAIKKYLLKHPDYFIQYPEVLAEIEVPSSADGLTDLTSHQLRTSQKNNRALKAQMSQLIQNAQQSESMMNRLFDLMLELSVVKKAAFLPEFTQFVVKNFPTDYFKVLVSDGMLELPESAHVDSFSAMQKTEFTEFQTKSEPLSGRLKKEKISSIFQDSEAIKSAIVLPIGPQAAFGLLAFASKDEEKFHPNSSSDLLQKLVQILVAYFEQLKTEDKNQATS